MRTPPTLDAPSLADEGPYADSQRVTSISTVDGCATDREAAVEAICNTPAQRSIAIGSVVRLKSGGPAMVVAELSRGDADARIARLVWTDDTGKEHEITLDTRCVE